MADPRTVGDYSAVPPALFEERRPAPSEPLLTAPIAGLQTSRPIVLGAGGGRGSRGFDHGTRSVLYKAPSPQADITVVQPSTGGGRKAAVQRDRRASAAVAPTPDHHGPLLCVLGPYDAGDTPALRPDYIAHGSLSMTGVVPSPLPPLAA